RNETIRGDFFRKGELVRAVIRKVEMKNNNPVVILSRTDNTFLEKLLEQEVPEIEDEVVRIVAVAREANPPSRQVGPRTKIAVDTLERDVDPVGACIGARGSRIQAVVNELRGEKIDVIRWSPDPATYISNALSPARVDAVVLANTEDRQAHVLVAEDQLSLAIGKEGQNVRLAARLTGWKIDIKDSAKYELDAEFGAEDDMPAEEELETESQTESGSEWEDTNMSAEAEDVVEEVVEPVGDEG
ncbi:MAG: transcription termination/antitermination protein NusA, partial [Cyanobacteria bacterium P01_A01_bin.17]